SLLAGAPEPVRSDDSLSAGSALPPHRAYRRGGGRSRQRRSRLPADRGANLRAPGGRIRRLRDRALPINTGFWAKFPEPRSSPMIPVIAAEQQLSLSV